MISCFLSSCSANGCLKSAVNVKRKWAGSSRPNTLQIHTTMSVMVWPLRSLDRLAHSTADLLELVEQLKAKGFG